jgi:hypothetical protein
MMVRQIVYISSLVLLTGLVNVGTSRLLPFFPGRLDADAAEHSDLERLQELSGLIKTEIGIPSASAQTHCKVIPFGSKPCGGPVEYLAYSTETTNEPRLKQLVNDFNRLAEKLNREKKLRSDCEFVGEPKVELVGGICRIPRN